MCRHHSLQRKLRSTGFSLVELVLVLGIMVTVSAIALPRYGQAASRYEADAAARCVVSELELVQRRARAASANCTITFASDRSEYQISLPGLDGIAGRAIKSDLPHRAKVKSADFGNSTSVTFNGYGMPLAGGSVTLFSGNEERVITVAATTGAISIQNTK